MPQNRVPQVLYLAVVDPNYPRNNRIRRALAKAGYEVTSTSLNLDSQSRYLMRLCRVFRSAIASREGDFIFLSELNLQYFPAAWFAARLTRRYLVVDWFVGMYETNIEDWKEAPPKSIAALKYALLDRMSVRFADLVVTDTDVRARKLNRFRRTASHRVLNLPVGSPDWIKSSARDVSAPFTVLFYGTYLPLHGVDTIIRAAASARHLADGGLLLVGSSPDRHKYEQLARELGVFKICNFVDQLETDALAELILQSDVVLGVFGKSAKAGSVIPNKVWQGLSAGRTVITRNSEAYEEIRSIVGDRLVEVEPTSESLAEAIDEAFLARGCQQAVSVESDLERYVESRYDQLMTVLAKEGRS